LDARRELTLVQVETVLIGQGSGFAFSTRIISKCAARIPMGAQMMAMDELEALPENKRGRESLFE